MLSACREVGIRGVHAGLDPAAPARIPRLREAARRSAAPPEFAVLVIGTDAPGSEPSPDLSSGGTEFLLEIVRDREPIREVEGARRAAEALVREWGCGAWGLAYPSLPAVPVLREDLRSAPSWVRFPFHLLSPPEADGAVEECRRASVPLVSSDPFADGRLDGSRLSSSPLEVSGRPRPSDWAELQRDWAPVLSLGFLTEGGRRTLPQAAVDFALGTPGVSGAIVSAPDPETLRGFGPISPASALTRVERTRIEALRRKRAPGDRLRASPALK